MKRRWHRNLTDSSLHSSSLCSFDNVASSTQHVDQAIAHLTTRDYRIDRRDRAETRRSGTLQAGPAESSL